MLIQIPTDHFQNSVGTTFWAFIWKSHKFEKHLIIEKSVKAIFVESSVPKRTIEALQAAVKSKGHEVTIGGTLYSDALGDAGTIEGTYIGMLDHNITLVTRALGGKAPERGLNNKLSH